MINKTLLNPLHFYCTFKSEVLSCFASAFNIPTKKPQRIVGIANLIWSYRLYPFGPILKSNQSFAVTYRDYSYPNASESLIVFQFGVALVNCNRDNNPMNMPLKCSREPPNGLYIFFFLGFMLVPKMLFRKLTF